MNGWSTPLMVDTLRISCKVDWHLATTIALNNALARAKQERRTPTASPEDDALFTSTLGVYPRASVKLGDLHLGIKPAGGLHPVVLSTGDWSAEVNYGRMKAEEQRSPSILVTFRSRALAQHGPAGCVTPWLDWCQLHLGRVQTAQLSRLDLAVDVASDEPTYRWLLDDQVVTKAINQRMWFDPVPPPPGADLISTIGGTEVAEADMPALGNVQAVISRDRTAFTSLHIGSRGRETAYLRLYDKRAQAVKEHVAHVRELWTALGWDGCPGVRTAEGRAAGSIWRVEFELGREWLTSHHVDHWQRLTPRILQQLWSTLTRRYFRIVAPAAGTAVDSRGRNAIERREERAPTPFWALVQSKADGAPLLARIPDALPAATDTLLTSAAGSLATAAAMLGWNRAQLAARIVDVAAMALAKLPARVALVPPDRQAGLVAEATANALHPDERRGELVREVLALLNPTSGYGEAPF